MNIVDKTIHERNVTSHLNEKEIHEILAEFVASKAKLNLKHCSKVSVFIRSKERTDTSGYEYLAEVELTKSLDDVLQEAGS